MASPFKGKGDYLKPKASIDWGGEDFSVSWRESADGRISDVRVTKGKALHRLPLWKRLLMPWRVFRFYRRPTAPLPGDE